jgi:aarF domain-containing kinase
MHILLSNILEFDYFAEANNLALIHRAIMPKWGSLVAVPRPITELCSKHILTMEFLEGVKLVDGIRAQYRQIAALQGKTLEQLESERNDAIRRGEFAYQSVQESRRQHEMLQWYGAVQDYLLNPSNLYKLCYNLSVFRLVTGPCEIQRTALPVDLGNMLELLCRVHGNEIFEHGTTS